MDKIAALVAYEIALTAIAKNIFQLHKVVALQLINLNIHTRTDLHCHSVQFLWQSCGDVNLQIYKWKNVTQGYISYYCPDSLTCPRMVMHFSNLFSSTDGDHCGWTGLHADWILILHDEKRPIDGFFIPCSYLGVGKELKYFRFGSCFRVSSRSHTENLGIGYQQTNYNIQM